MQLFADIAEIFVLGGIASAVIIAADLNGCRQQMRIMRSVWILTGLWASFFGLLAYFVFGRDRRCRERNRTHPADPQTVRDRAAMPAMIPDENEMSGMKSGREIPDDLRTEQTVAGTMSTEGMRMQEMPMNMPGMQMGPRRPGWQSVVLSTLHCGAGCTLADLIGEWFLFFVPVAIGGSLLAGSWVIDYLLALAIGIGFQYAAIREMEPRTPRKTVAGRAAKADVLSLTAWQAGMYGWMAIAVFVIHHGTPLPRTSFGFWFMMQIAMACGFLLSLPVNVLLIRYGIKKGM